MSNTKGLNSHAIKFIAIIAMTLDHIGWVACPGFPAEVLPLIIHIFGRITCPIMCYFVAEGYYHTKNINRYTARMFIFAFISHFAYMFAPFNYKDVKSFIPFAHGEILNQTGVMWSLAWGLVMLRVVKSEKIKTVAAKVVLVLIISLITFPADWSCIAALCILAFGTNRGKLRIQTQWMLFYVGIYSVGYFFLVDKVYAFVQMCVLLAIPFIKLYNGKRAESPIVNTILKWLFYIYYPLHLVVLGLIF